MTTRTWPGCWPRCGTYAMWDDHEVQNDFDSTHPNIPEGRQAFREYWPVRGAVDDPTVLYRRFAWGPAADFFVLDCRQYRSPRAMPTAPARRCWARARRRG